MGKIRPFWQKRAVSSGLSRSPQNPLTCPWRVRVSGFVRLPATAGFARTVRVVGMQSARAVLGGES